MSGARFHLWYTAQRCPQKAFHQPILVSGDDLGRCRFHRSRGCYVGSPAAAWLRYFGGRARRIHTFAVLSRRRSSRTRRNCRHPDLTNAHRTSLACRDVNHSWSAVGPPDPAMVLTDPSREIDMVRGFRPAKRDRFHIEADRRSVRYIQFSAGKSPGCFNI